MQPRVGAGTHKYYMNFCQRMHIYWTVAGAGLVPGLLYSQTCETASEFAFFEGFGRLQEVWAGFRNWVCNGFWVCARLRVFARELRVFARGLRGNLFELFC